MMYVFGGHTLTNASGQEISNELFVLDLKTMVWKAMIPDSTNIVQPLAYMASTQVLTDNTLHIFGGLTQDSANNQFIVTNEVL